jgi:hypothetical protein
VHMRLRELRCKQRRHGHRKTAGNRLGLGLGS